MSGWLESLEAFVARQLPAAESISLHQAGSMPAGASNATVALDLHLVCDSTSHVVPLILRPQRQGGILAPYDIGRQFAIMRALTATPVPVPPVFWHEPGPEVVGVPFFFMSRLMGVRTPPLFWYQPGPLVDAAAAALAAIHAIDWQASALRGILPPESPSPLAAEMAAWAPRTALTGAAADPVLARLAEVLLANEPGDAEFRMTHGDTNAGNYLFRGDRIAAVVDWELGAIGDPRSDLGFYGALEWMFGSGVPSGGRSLLSDAYERVTRRAPGSLEFYEAWGLYRMLVIFGGGMWNPYGVSAALSRLDEILGRGWRS